MKLSTNNKSLYWIISGIILLIIAVAIFIYFSLRPSKTIEASRTTELTQTTNQLHLENNALPSPFDPKMAKTPKQKRPVQIVKQATPSITTKTPKQKQSIQVAKKIPLSAKHKKIAIIIDDLGYNLTIAKKFIALPFTLNFSILPHTPFSTQLAKQLKRQKKEILLHLPLEPINIAKHNPGKNALYVKDSLVVMQKKLASHFLSVPYTIGVNNHMGSAFSKSNAAAEKLMKLLQKHTTYFIDSKTAPGALLYKKAKKYHIPFAARQLFLDPSQSVSIAKQWSKVIPCAQRRKYCIIIAHPHPKTYAFLKKHLSELTKKKISLIHLHEIFQH